MQQLGLSDAGDPALRTDRRLEALRSGDGHVGLGGGIDTHGHHFDSGSVHLGRGNIQIPVADLARQDHDALARNIHLKIFHIERCGDITFHGPGQLVCYPILDLERIGIGLREYIEALEEAVIRTVAEYGIAAGRIAGASGAWIDPGKARPRKICAIGVRSSRYVTMHGFALNVTTDLEWFSRINPCGFTDRGVTSIAAETGSQPSIQEVKQLVIRELATALQCEITSGS